MKRTLAVLVCLSAAASLASAQGYYKTITIDADYSDWDDVPVLDSDPIDNIPGNTSFIDFAETKIANDGEFLYIYNSYHNPVSLGSFTSIDFDSDTATGYDIFGLGLIGAEAGWQNDFPFTQDAANFNNGSGMTGDFFGSGAGLLDQFVDSTQREMAISLDIVFNAGGGKVFDDDTFDILFWTDLAAGDVTAAISYQLATVPEPTTLLLALPALLGLARRR